MATSFTMMKRQVHSLLKTIACCSVAAQSTQLQADNGQFFVEMDAAWTSEVNHARRHYRTWSDVFMAAQSHVHYLRIKGLRQDRWHSRAVQVKNT